MFHKNFSLKKLPVLFLMGVFLVPGGVLASPSVNVTIDSSDLEPFSIDKKTDPEYRPTFYSDNSMAVGINDNGEPNIGTRF